MFPGYADWSVYLLASEDCLSYVGMSRNPWHRLLEHNSGKCIATKGHLWHLVAILPGLYSGQARALELYLKRGDTVRKRGRFARNFGPVPQSNPVRFVYWVSLPLARFHSLPHILPLQEVPLCVVRPYCVWLAAYGASFAFHTTYPQEVSPHL